MERRAAIHAYLDVVSDNANALKAKASEIAKAATILIECLGAGNKVLFCGNGGSAADAQHLAAELMGRYRRERAPMAAVAITVDTSTLTAVSNDYAFDDVFARQVRGLGRTGDVLVALSTSGNSKNVVNAATAAKALGMQTIAMTGKGGGALKDLADLTIAVPSPTTSHIQEMHIAVGHLLCGFVEDALG